MKRTRFSGKRSISAPPWRPRSRCTGGADELVVDLRRLLRDDTRTCHAEMLFEEETGTQAFALHSSVRRSIIAA